MKYVVVALLAAAIVAPAAQDKETLLEQLDREQQAVLERVEKSIVTVATGGVVQFHVKPDAALAQLAFARAVGDGGRAFGFVVGDGLVLTSCRAPAKNTTVTLADGRDLKAKVACRSDAVGLTLLKVDDAASLPPALELGDDAKSRRGALVLVPRMRGERLVLRLDTVADRTAPAGSRVSRADFIELDQTDGEDADGMPILDARGRVVGLVSTSSVLNVFATAVTQGTVDWGTPALSIAKPRSDGIPAATIRAFIDIAAKTGGFKRGVIGVELETTGEGVRVTHASDAMPAAKAGIAEGDVILSIDGAPVTTVPDCLKIIPFKAGEKVKLRVRHGKDEADVEVGVVGEEPRRAARGEDSLGVDVMTLTGELKRLLGAEVEGVVVRRVLPGSAADAAGLKRYDIVTAIGETPVKTREDFAKALEDLKDGAYSTWMVWRDNVESPTVVKIRR